MVAASDVVFDLIGDLLEADIPNANLFYVAGGVIREFTSEFFANVTARGEEVQSGLVDEVFCFYTAIGEGTQVHESLHFPVSFTPGSLPLKIS